MEILILEGLYSVYRFEKNAVIPAVFYSSEFWSVTKTSDEVSVISSAGETDLPGLPCEKGWRIIKIEGPLSFSLTGIIAHISRVLAEKEIPIFVTSTYDTDYVMVREQFLARAITAMKEAGYSIENQAH